jgi:hypothetical protein
LHTSFACLHRAHVCLQTSFAGLHLTLVRLPTPDVRRQIIIANSIAGLLADNRPMLAAREVCFRHGTDVNQQTSEVNGARALFADKSPAQANTPRLSSARRRFFRRASRSGKQTSRACAILLLS